jgi:ribosome assembly protein RRB1
VDKSIAIWDTRLGRSPAASFQAHKADVNVLSWNRYSALTFGVPSTQFSFYISSYLLYFIVLSRLASCMLASGSDDGTISIRDLRLLKVCW